MIVLISILTILGILLYYYSKSTYSYWESRGIPTHPGASLPFGNLKNMTRPKMFGLYFQDFYNYFKEKGFKHGGAYIFQTPVYIPVEPELLKHIMTKDYDYFEEKGVYYNEVHQPIQGHLFNIGGQRWKNLRVKLTPTFTSGKMKAMYPAITNCSLPLVEKVNEYCASGKSFNVKDVCALYTTDVIGTCAFGIECNSFKNPNSEFCEAGRRLVNLDFKQKIEFPFATSFPNLAKKLRIVNFPKTVAEFYTKIAQDTAKYREETNVSRNDLMQLLLELKKKGAINLQELICQAFVFFAAGFETSSSAMAHCLMELCINPELQEKAREEVFKVMKKHDNEMTYECVNEMKYLEQCMYETLRKYPALAILNRECTKEYKVPGTDVVLEKGTKVFIPLMGLHMDPEYYPNPDQFDPERFSDENKQKRHHYTWLPFGEGPRICIGLRFGVLQAKVGLIQLLSRYRFKLMNKIEYPVKIKNGILVHTQEDIILSATKI